MPDMTWWERLTLIPLLAIILAIGLYPLPMLQLQEGSLRLLIAHVLGRPV